MWLRLLPTRRFFKLADRLYRHRLHDGQTGRTERALQIHKTVLAKLLYVRRLFELPTVARLAIAGNTRGDAFYRAAAAEAGFVTVSNSHWDVLAVTDFAHLTQYRQAVKMSTAWPAEMIGNLVVRQLRGRPAARKADCVMSRRSIIHLTTFLQGGAGRAITELACAQHRSGDSVLVVASRTGEGGYQSYPHYLEQLHDAGVPVLLEDSTFKRDIDLNQRVLERLVAVRRPDTTDLVHAHAGVPARIAQRYAALASRPIVVVQTQHGWGINKTREQARDDLATLRSVDRVIVTSEASRQWLIEQGVLVISDRQHPVRALGNDSGDARRGARPSGDVAGRSPRDCRLRRLSDREQEPATAASRAHPSSKPRSCRGVCRRGW